MRLGYIVIGNGASELSNYPDGPKQGILLQGDGVTVFGSYEAARHAIRRTKKYEAEHGFKWRTEFMHIQPLKKFAVPPRDLPRKHNQKSITKLV